MLESAKPPAHGFAHAGRIDTGTAGECQALGHGFDGDPDDDLVGGLGDLSGPAGADVNRFCPDSVKDRLGTRHGGILAAGHDRQRRAFGAAVPPETGASTNAAPRVASSRANSRVASTSVVPMSMMTLPESASGPFSDAMPFSPKSTASTAAVSATMITTSSAAAATSAGLPPRPGVCLTSRQGSQGQGQSGCGPPAALLPSAGCEPLAGP